MLLRLLRNLVFASRAQPTIITQRGNLVLEFPRGAGERCGAFWSPGTFSSPAFSPPTLKHPPPGGPWRLAKGKELQRRVVRRPQGLRAQASSALSFHGGSSFPAPSWASQLLPHPSTLGGVPVCLRGRWVVACSSLGRDKSAWFCRPLIFETKTVWRRERLSLPGVPSWHT